MFETLKIFHMFAIMGLGASGIGGGILMARARRAGGKLPDYVRSTMRTVVMIGVGSAVLMWITGFGMVLGHDVTFGLWFSLKLLGSAAVLVASAVLAIAVTRSAASGQMPEARTMQLLMRAGQVGMTLALVFGVIAFS